MQISTQRPNHQIALDRIATILGRLVPVVQVLIVCVVALFGVIVAIPIIVVEALVAGCLLPG